MPVIGALPLYMVGQSPGHLPPESGVVFSNYINAFFEAMSGFTSTGLTMAERPSALPHVLQWWRSFMQWVAASA